MALFAERIFSSFGRKGHSKSIQRYCSRHKGVSVQLDEYEINDHVKSPLQSPDLNLTEHL